MTPDPDVSVIRGTRTRYACRSVAEVDAHLAGLLDWLRVNLPAMRPAQRVNAEMNFGRDIDRLLHARLMLAALATLDEDLTDLSVGILRERDTVLR